MPEGPLLHGNLPVFYLQSLYRGTDFFPTTFSPHSVYVQWGDES